jgi:uncharacterized protein
MGRLIVLIVLVVAGIWLVRRALRAGAPGESAARSSRSADELVACARCGVHLPRAEARAAAGGLYCSEEHARLGKL